MRNLNVFFKSGNYDIKLHKFFWKRFFDGIYNIQDFTNSSFRIDTIPSNSLLVHSIIETSTNSFFEKNIEESPISNYYTILFSSVYL